LAEIKTIGLAKEFEHIFTADQESPLSLSSDSKALHILQHIRDEAHRFALSYHRTLRKRSVSKSALDGIRGVGPARKKIILNYFGSLTNLKNASLSEISSVSGIPKDVAKRIYESFSPK
jgi:excinuclease ABC subunit C